MTYKLTNFIFRRMFRMTKWVYLALFISEICLFYMNSGGGSGRYRFEQMLEKAGVGTIFLVSYFSVLVIFTVVLAGFYTGSKSIYSVVSLPVNPGNLLFALVFPCVMNILLLYCVQSLTVILLGQWYPRFVIKQMNDYLLLAFLRYKPISILFPFTGMQVCKTLLIAVATSVIALFTFISAAARKYGNFVLSASCTLLIILIYNTDYNTEHTALLIAMLLFVTLLCAFMLLQAGKYIKRRAVV